MSIFPQIAEDVWRGAEEAGIALPATLVKVTPGTRTSGNQSGGTNPTEATFAAAGFVQDFSAYELAQGLVEVGDRKICLYGASIASGVAPSTNDKVTIGGSTYRIRTVKTDPANAVYVVQTHGGPIPA